MEDSKKAREAREAKAKGDELPEDEEKAAEETEAKDHEPSTLPLGPPGLLPPTTHLRGKPWATHDGEGVLQGGATEAESSITNWCFGG